MSKLLIIHPHDPTTFFLKPIWSFIEKAHSNTQVIYIGCNDDEHKTALETLVKPEYNKVLFLGHGSSTGLVGAKDRGYTHNEFLDKSKLEVFQDKNVLSLSCRSSDFFRFQNHFNYIGFDDIPSEIAEIIGARELESDRYPNVDEEVLEKFRSIIVEIICNCVNEWLLCGYTIQNVYNRIRIRINNMIVQLLLSEKDLKFKRATVGLLNDLKNNMTHFHKA